MASININQSAIMSSAVQPLVSVIIPAYNEEDNITNAILSVVSQTYRNIEIIVIDDGSSDHTYSKALSIGDPRLIVLKNGANRGFLHSLNYGLSESKGTYIARLDADDIADPKRIELQMSFLIENPEIKLLGSFGYIISGQTNERLEVTLPTSHNEIISYLVRENAFIHSCVIFDRETYMKLGGYREFSGLEDYDLWVRMAGISRVANLPYFLVTRYENMNFETRPFYSKIKKSTYFKRKLQIQVAAMKEFQVKIQYLPYILKTVLLFLKFRFMEKKQQLFFHGTAQ
jgi:glycosyltransferase involved in cell wall biosynthesis